MAPKTNDGFDCPQAKEPKNPESDEKGSKVHQAVVFSEGDIGDKVDLEDALEQIGMGRYTYGVLLISCYTLLAVSTEIFGVGLLVTSSQCDLDLNTYRKGIVGAVPMLGILASAHTWGYVADTRGRRFAMLVALAGTCILGLASSIVGHWIALAVLKFFSVIFASGGNAVVYAFLVETTPRARRVGFMMVASTCLMLSQTLIATLGYITLRYDFNIFLEHLGMTYRPWRLLAQVIGIVNAGALVMFLTCVYESPKFYVSQGREAEAIEVLRNVYAINTGNKRESFPVKSIIMNEDINKNKDVGLLLSMWNQTAPLFHRKFLKNTLLLTYVAVIVFSTAPPLVIWLPHIINAFMRASPVPGQDSHFCGRVVSELARSKNETVTLGICNDKIDDLVLYTMMVLGSIITVIGLLSTVFGKWLGKRSVVICLNIIGGLCCFLLNHVNGDGSLVVFLFIMSNAMVMGIVSAFAVEIYPTYLRSMAVCLTIMAGRGASFIIINSIGVQVEQNCEHFFYFYGAFIVSGALVGAFLPGEQNQKENNR